MMDCSDSIEKVEDTNLINDELLKKVELEASEVVKVFMQEDMLGYKYYLYQEMKKRFDELGIDWEIPCSDSPSISED